MTLFNAGLAQRAVAYPPPTKTVVNAFSTAGAAPIAIAGGTGLFNAKNVATGALTANTLANLLTLTGSGRCSMAAVASVDATARTHRLQIIVDGSVAFDATSASTAAGGSGIFAAGATVSSALIPGDPIYFNSSFSINYASSLSETGKTNLGVIYAQN